MEIRNNQQYYNRQNFGMAFRLPEKKSAQDAFANLVSNYGEKPYNVVERSLTSLIERHANDKHFDFTFDGEKFVIEPKTYLALEMYTDGIKLSNKPLKGTWEKFLTNYGDYDEVVENLKGFNRFCYEAKYVGSLLKSSIAAFIKPFDTLPVELRQASRDVSELEDAVSKHVEKLNMRNK
ncbi:hypothetical protein IKL64_05700 [bacterium]|nr:hypothetical protein [bacterium]